MSQPEVYQGIKAYLSGSLTGLSQWTLGRVALLVSGIIKARHVAPARIAEACVALLESGAGAESIERRIRRIENDPKIQVETCFHPLVRQVLNNSELQEVLLIFDPTTQEDRVVLLSLNLRYRGRSLPLVWEDYPANQVLEGDGMNQRIQRLFQCAKALLPAGVEVTVLADRAFGISSFVELVEQQGWHWILRLKSSVHVRDHKEREMLVRQLVSAKGQRRKMHGEIFKKAGWRPAYLAVLWGRRFSTPLCVASDRDLNWELLRYYQRRFAIEPSFRDWKSAGWHWEQCQVTEAAHLRRLLIAMALACWLTLLVGALAAQSLLCQPASGQRRTRPWSAKYSLFQWGLKVWSMAFDLGVLPILRSAFPDWSASNWSQQLLDHHRYAFLFS